MHFKECNFTCAYTIRHTKKHKYWVGGGHCKRIGGPLFFLSVLGLFFLTFLVFLGVLDVLFGSNRGYFLCLW